MSNEASAQRGSGGRNRSALGNPRSAISTDRGHLLTEQRNEATRALDDCTVEEALRLINAQDAEVPAAVGRAVPALTALVERVVKGMQKGGRLIYVGAGTSGRLGVLDASEIPPTFHADPDRVVGIIAGGDSALRVSSEGKEDDPEGAVSALEPLGLDADDTLVGIAAGGTTPYVWGAIDYAKKRGAGTAMICCVALDGVPQARDIHVDNAIELLVGPEVVTGSTRMKSGTATKLALNMISTVAMVRLGKVWGNLMIDLKASNAKLRDRAARIIVSQSDLNRDAALDLLDDADGRVKLALVMAARGVDRSGAQHLLDTHEQRLRPILGAPR